MAKRRYYRSGMVQWIDDEGRAHREDGPAEVWKDGTQWWLRHGWAHFAYGPADLWSRGTLAWYEDKKLLRGREPYG